MRTPAQRYAAIRPPSLHQVCEQPALFDEAAPPDEISVQAQWFSGDFGTSFQTTDGREAEIVQLGTWNRGEGPDFQDCAIRLEGSLLTGPIELDLDVRDWMRHGHHENPAFNGVILHLFLGQGERQVFTRTADHRNIPQIRLEPPGTHNPAPNNQPLAKAGRCSSPLADLGSDELAEVLLAAAQFRMKRKAARMNRLAAMRGAGEALFQLLAEALGYKQNKLPFTLLAQRLTLKDLRRDPELAEALIFGAGGFLPEKDLGEYTRDTRDYVKYLWSQWWQVRSQYERLRLPMRLWKLSGSRPSNHPQRRLAALSEIVRRWKSIQSLAAFRDAGEVFEMLGDLTHGYWDHHYTLTSKRSEKRLALIGESRIVEILANVLYPSAIEADSRKWEDYIRLPAPLGNRSAETAATRLLGKNPEHLKALRSAAKVQGLLQIFEDFCKRDATNCMDCPFPEQFRRFKEL